MSERKGKIFGVGKRPFVNVGSRVNQDGERFGRGQGRGEGVPSRRTRPSSGRSATPEKHRVGRGFRVFSILCRDDSYDDEIMVVACRRASFQLLHDEGEMRSQREPLSTVCGHVRPARDTYQDPNRCSSSSSRRRRLSALRERSCWVRVTMIVARPRVSWAGCSPCLDRKGR